MTERSITWEQCSSQRNDAYHTQYRGFDVHRWPDCYCFYPTEGEATSDELIALMERIQEAGLGGILIPQPPAVRFHGQCELRQRTSDAPNFCLSVAKLSALDALDAIIDRLWAEAFPQRDVALPQQYGRVR